MHAAVAQSVERAHGKGKVTGSIPVCGYHATHICLIKHRESSPGRASSKGSIPVCGYSSNSY